MVKNIAIIENNILATNTIRRKLTITLIELGFNVTVLTTGTQSELEKARDKGIRVIDLKTGNGNVIALFRYLVNLRRALIKLQPDVCLTFTIRPNIWGNFIARRLNIPVISNVTGTGPLFENKGIFYRLARGLYKAAIKKTNWIFFQNNDDKDKFLNQKFVKRDNIQVIPGSGVDTQYFSPLEFDKQNKGFIFLFIGRLIKDKGIVEFIEAAKFMKQHHSGMIFKIVGPLWEQNLKSNTITKRELDTWVAKGIIEYEGIADDVRPYISEADCIVLPSYREGMSNILLEAGSMGKPCITTNVTGCKEIIDDGITGFLCRPKDSRDLADKMIKMAASTYDERKEMGKLAREKIKFQFNKKLVIDAYLQAIANI